jgi:hypothetical protein
MKRFFRLLLPIACACGLLAAAASTRAQNAQQLAFAGLRSVAGKGQFNAVASDAAGELYLLLDQKDGVRVLKTDANATQILSEAHIGAQGDIGVALALDPAGNVYVTGTTASETLPTTSGVPFPSPADSTTNSFVAKFDSGLHTIFVTYAGSGRMAATSIAATADRVFIAGSIFASTLPVTPSAILQTPASGSTDGNGFVESFNASGASLVYATYLSGLNGDSSAAAIAADADDNAYIAGYTTSTGFPTVSAVVPEMIGAGSGFLIKLTPAGDGIVFSTFLPGSGVTSLALDAATQTLLFSGTLAPGAFPIATVTAPIVAADYQSVVRMPLDGSRVLNSTLVAPGAQSIVTPAPNGAAWAALPLTSPLLPLAAVSGLGSTAAFRITAQNTIDQSIRFGGSSTQFSSLPVNLLSIATDASGQPVFAGSAMPTTSASLLASQTFDLPLLNSPTVALPSTLRDAVLAPGTNCGSACAGSGAYLAKLNLAAGTALALSTDASPNIVLRNLGSASAINLQVSTNGFTVAHDCPNQFGAGAECDIVLTGNGPGSVTVQAANATTQTVNIPAVTRPASTLVYSPREIDFGVVNALDAPATRTVTVTNLGTTPETSALGVSFGTNANWTTGVSGDCPGFAASQPLQPGASCHLTVSASVPSGASDETAFQSVWSSGVSSITLTGFTALTALHLSASQISFGTQFVGGLRLSRYLYLSNNSGSSIQHAPVAIGPDSPFTIADRCPTMLGPHTVCQIQIDYESPTVSSDSVTLSLDQGSSVLVTGRTISQPGAGGSSANPNLVVTPTDISFPNAVVVTNVSPDVHTVTVTNTGAVPFPLGITLTGDFTDSTDCTSTLAAGASCSVVLSFTPSQPGVRQGLLAISSGASTTPVYVNLNGTGTPILAANNGTLDLGSSPIGQPVVLWTKITQSFSQLTASTGGDFGVVLIEDIGYGHGQPAISAFAPSATGTCFNCWLGVQFVPSTTAARAASLSLTSSTNGMPYTLALTGNGLPLTGLLLTPVQQEFGPIAVHSSSAPTLFTLTNLSSTAANLTAPSATGDFAISNTVSGGPTCTGPLAPNASCFVQVVYEPTATGPVSGSLTLASDTTTATASLSGFGLADPGLSLNPSALIFRNVPSPSATQQTITVKNTGLYNLQIAPPTADVASFQATTTCGSLVPGATCTVTVTFTPANAILAGTLSIPVTSAASGNPQTIYTVPLSGAYTDEDSGLQILPGEADYGPTPTSTLGVTRQFLINNLTTKPVTLSLSLPRQFVLTQPPCGALAPGAGCSFSVSFLPLTNGEVTGTVFAQATPTDGSATLNGLGYLQGFGQGRGSLAVTGDEVVDFHQVASGQSASRILTLSNPGAVAITVRRITSEWPFLSSTTCGSTLAVAQSCTVTLAYSPLNQVAAGSSSAPFNTDAGTLVIESDAVSSPDFIDLTGTVTPATVAAPSNAAPLVAFATSQSSLTFESTAGGNISAPQTLTLSNTGTATIHVSRLATTPDFAVTGSCAVVVPGASCPLTVTFTPQASSSQTVTTVASALEITSDSSTSLDFVSLLGTATPPSLALSPVALDFGPVLVGVSATLPIHITNGSHSPAIFQSVKAAGDYNIGGDCPASGGQLASSASCTLQVIFKPTQAGVRTGTVSVATSLTALPLIANLTGIGAQSHLQSTPTSLSFGDTALGKSTSLTVSLANNGTATVNGVALSVTGDYVITQPCISTAFAPGAACTAIVTFLPKATGVRSGTLTIVSSDPSSPIAIPLTGNGISSGGGGTTTGSFTLAVNGGASSSVTVKSGQPASYPLALTPQDGFTGLVVLNCTPVRAGQYASCSLLPSSVSLNGTAQSSAVTINTVTEDASAKAQRAGGTGFAVFLLPFGLLLFRRGRGAFLVALVTTAAMFASGCGSGGTIVLGDPSLRYTPPGTYQYLVTASSSTGTPLSKTVTLNLTVTKP